MKTYPAQGFTPLQAWWSLPLILALSALVVGTAMIPLAFLATILAQLP